MNKPSKKEMRALRKFMRLIDPPVFMLDFKRGIVVDEKGLPLLHEQIFQLLAVCARHLRKSPRKLTALAESTHGHDHNLDLNYFRSLPWRGYVEKKK